MSTIIFLLVMFILTICIKDAYSECWKEFLKDLVKCPINK